MNNFDEVRKALENFGKLSQFDDLIEPMEIEAVKVQAPPESETALGQLKALNEQLTAAKEIIESLEKAIKEKDKQAEKAKVKAQWFSLGLSVLGVILGFLLNHVLVNYL